MHDQKNIKIQLRVDYDGSDEPKHLAYWCMALNYRV